MTIKNLASFELQLNWAAILVLVLLIASCKKEPLVGEGIQPGVQQQEVLVQDTFSIFSRTVREDSLKTGGASRILVGEVNDPVFGYSKYTSAFEIHPPIGEIVLDGILDLQIDSVILTLPFVDTYGSLDAQDFDIKQLDAQIDTADFYSNSLPAASGNDLCLDGAITPEPGVAKEIGGVTESPSIRLHLDHQFGRDLICQPKETYNSKEDFLEFMPGLLISSSANRAEGAGLYLNPQDEFTRLTVYFRDDSTSDHFNVVFSLGDSSMIVHHFEHDYINSDVDSALKSTATGSENIYVQSAAGVKAEINIPYLTNLAEIKPVVHEAVVVFGVETLTGSFAPHDQLYLFAMDGDGVTRTIPDLFRSDYGGNFDDANNTYSFNITEYAQDLIDGQTDITTLVLLDNSGYLNTQYRVDRTVLSGSTGSTPIHLQLTYSIPK